jgi:hypothetical protein
MSMEKRYKGKWASSILEYSWIVTPNTDLSHMPLHFRGKFLPV